MQHSASPNRLTDRRSHAVRLVVACLLTLLMAGLARPAHAQNSLVVTNPTDTAVAGETDLRQAVAFATGGTAGTMTPVITFAASGIGDIELTQIIQIEAGSLTSLTINGPNDGSLTVDGSKTLGCFWVMSGSVTFFGLTIANGVTEGEGAGIANNAELTVNSCTFSGNHGIAPNNSGGAIYGQGGTLTVNNCTFSNNSVNGNQSLGGAIYTDSTTTITNSTFSSNSVGSEGEGGAIFCAGGPYTISNCTFSGNSAPQGGAVYVQFGNSATMVNNTIAGTGSGLYVESDETQGLGTATLLNNLFANSGGNLSGGGTITSLGHNLFTDTPTNLTLASGDKSGVADPGLASGLASNGGPTQTIALKMTSHAIDAGDSSVFTGTDAPGLTLTMDQRGYPRKSGSNVDIGAYEYSAFNITGTVTDSVTQAGVPGITITAGGALTGKMTTNSSGQYSFIQVPSGTTYTLTPSDPAVNYSFVANPSPASGTVTAAVTQNFVATQLFTVSGQVTDSVTGTGINGVTITASGGLAGTQTTATINSVAGSYAFANVPNGTTYTLTPSDNTVNYVFTANPSPASGTVSSDITENFTAAQITTISGNVTLNGFVPSPAVTLTLTGGAAPQTTTTDGSGNYSFTVVPGTYTITPTTTLTGVLFSPTSFPNIVEGNANTPNENFTATRPISISGNIASNTGIVLFGVTVGILGKNTSFSGSTTTDSSGNFGFSGLQPDTYTLTPHLSSNYTYSPNPLTVVVQITDLTNQNITASVLGLSNITVSRNVVTPALGRIRLLFTGPLNPVNSSNFSVTVGGEVLQIISAVFSRSGNEVNIIVRFPPGNNAGTVRYNGLTAANGGLTLAPGQVTISVRN